MRSRGRRAPRPKCSGPLCSRMADSVEIVIAPSRAGSSPWPSRAPSCTGALSAGTRFNHLPGQKPLPAVPFLRRVVPAGGKVLVLWARSDRFIPPNRPIARLPSPLPVVCFLHFRVSLSRSILLLVIISSPSPSRAGLARDGVWAAPPAPGPDRAADHRRPRVVASCEDRPSTPLAPLPNRRPFFSPLLTGPTLTHCASPSP